MITTKGKGLWAAAIGNSNNDYTATSKETGATTLEVAGTPWTLEQFVGQDVFSEASVGTILSNTTNVLTVARWEKPGKRGETAGTTPTKGGPFYIAAGTTPAAWIALTANAEAPKESNETLAGELPSGSEKGLGRKLAIFKYLGGKEYEVKLTFTAESKDTVPVTVAKIGIFNAQHGGIMLFETLLSSTAEVKESGDSVTVTDIVTGS